MSSRTHPTRERPARRSASQDPIDGADLRRGAQRAEPPATFVVVEMAILVVVAALAMASIIVTTGCSGVDARTRAATTTQRTNA